jgi:predicted RNase H-like HicB family nuclease
LSNGSKFICTQWIHRARRSSPADSAGASDLWREQPSHSLLEKSEPKDEIALVNLKIVVELGEDGYFVAYCPSLKSGWSQGKSRKDALKNVREAIDLYLEHSPAELAASKEREVVELTI